MNPLFCNRAEITPAVLSQILQTDVLQVTSEPLVEEASFNAQLLHLHLIYAQPNEGAPKSLIAKLPVPNADLLESAAVFQPGKKETWFYEHGAKRIAVRTPRCYYSALDPATGQSILLLEDLSAARRVSQVAGASIDDAKSALTALASLHATWWQSDEIRETFYSETIGDDEDAGEALVESFFHEAWPRFCADPPIDLPESVRQFGDYLMKDMWTIGVGLKHSPKTLIHGDFRLDNILFDDQNSCWLIDWEDIYYAHGVFDVAWFIGGCVDIEDTGSVGVEMEKGLLSHYYDQLIGAGVRDYSWEDCQRDYRTIMYDAFSQGVMSARWADPVTVYDLQFGNAIGQRFIRTCERLKLHEYCE